MHRDLKPENILMVSPDSDIDVKITDFGLAKQADQDGLKTFCGTPQYFAPEVLQRRGTVRGQGRYGKEADMWSLGVICYILLSGTMPFNDAELYDHIENANYTMEGQEWENVSDVAKHFVESLLAVKPKDRLTADRALKHPWFTGEEFVRPVSPPLLPLQPPQQSTTNSDQAPQSSSAGAGAEA
eukprot:CAMPEP_0113951730 /NCGR_PEP_ID=MMETSP1339-20121228/87644_1 /TAXON_ID=94617 /ORGANISM="Fibrocapsa japonica" /LENGTH=183 /DNA_ID=CAMNT_0000960069 /DNA_START=81 /DNA_END=628 /DNA_ORIENTATION=- /assembly_acc=CAM_ASM_000762